MKIRLALLKDILFQPVFLVIEVILALLGNYDTIASRFPALPPLVAKIAAIHQVAGILYWFSKYWGYFFLAYLMYAIFEGIYQKATPYLGEKIFTEKVLLTAEEEHSTDSDLYAWIRVQNNENEDLRDCYAIMKTIAFNLQGRWVNRTDSINPNQAQMDWPIFKDGREVIVRRGTPARINVFKSDTDGFAFVFSNGDVHIRQDDFVSSSYYVEVNVGGTLYGKPILEIEIHGFIDFESEFVVDSPNPNNRLFIRVGELGAPIEFLGNK